MPPISQEKLVAYRTKTHRQFPGGRIKTREEAIQFVNERGFIFFWPIQEIVLPSLWVAVAGDRPVADAHDDPGHVTWGWKDSLLGKRVWYYAKLLRKRSTIVSLDVIPYFYALSENYGSPEEDYLTLYEQGRLTLESKAVYEAILQEGPLNAVELRRAARMTSQESDTRFNRALTDLQADLKILPIGVAQAGRWNYAFMYEIVARHYPEMVDQARLISERQACRKLTELYLRSVGAARLNDVQKLFGWSTDAAKRALDELAQAGAIYANQEIGGQKGRWCTLRELIEDDLGCSPGDESGG